MQREPRYHPIIEDVDNAVRIYEMSKGTLHIHTEIAREIASWWTSAVYPHLMMFAQTGSIDSQVFNDLARLLPTIVNHDDKRDLEALRAYLTASQ